MKKQTKWHFTLSPDSKSQGLSPKCATFSQHGAARRAEIVDNMLIVDNMTTLVCHIFSATSWALTGDGKGRTSGSGWGLLQSFVSLYIYIYIYIYGCLPDWFGGCSRASSSESLQAQARTGGTARRRRAGVGFPLEDRASLELVHAAIINVYV